MRKYNQLFIVAAALSLASCSHKSQIVTLDEQITAPKRIAVTGTRAPWVSEIEKRIRKHGFTIKRYASQSAIIEKQSSSRSKMHDKAASRYVVEIDGFAPNDVMNRCLGGGYNFNYINVEVIDVKANEVVAHYSNNGFSENCPPFSQPIFSDIAVMINDLWVTQ